MANNTTTYAVVWSPAVTVPFGLYDSSAAVLGLLGNCLMLLLSAKYDALKLDEVSLLFVHNLAVADILYTVIRATSNIIHSIQIYARCKS